MELLTLIIIRTEIPAIFEDREIVPDSYCTYNASQTSLFKSHNIPYDN